MNIRDLKHVDFQAKGMRKPDSCVVYPFSASNPTRIMFQGDRTIGEFDTQTGKGVVNYKGSNSKYGMHLNSFLGAVPYEFDQSFVEACKAAQPHGTITLA